MKAMIINQFGDSNVFTLADIAKPDIKAGHVLVQVAATSIRYGFRRNC